MADLGGGRFSRVRASSASSLRCLTTSLRCSRPSCRRRGAARHIGVVASARIVPAITIANSPRQSPVRAGDRSGPASVDSFLRPVRSASRGARACPRLPRLLERVRSLGAGESVLVTPGSGDTKARKVRKGLGGALGSGLRRALTIVLELSGKFLFGRGLSQQPRPAPQAGGHARWPRPRPRWVGRAPAQRGPVRPEPR